MAREEMLKARGARRGNSESKALFIKMNKIEGIYGKKSKIREER
jgi:hypothetical protein